MKNNTGPVITSIGMAFLTLTIATGFMLRGHVLHESDEAYPTEPIILPLTDDAALANDRTGATQAPPAKKSVDQVATPTSPTKLILEPVAFISQAPRGQWDNQDFQDGCEEASILMAMNWATGATLNMRDATTDIQRLIDWQHASPGGYHHDISVHDTAQLIRDYYHYEPVTIREEVTAQTLIDILGDGSVIIAPVNGQLLDNPYFTAPGPEYHMLVVIGYDPVKKEFITNDPGTRRGKQFRYKEAQFMTALRDYPSGHHEPITEHNKRIIIVNKR